LEADPAILANDFLHDAAEPALGDDPFAWNRRQMAVDAPHRRRAGPQVQVAAFQFQHAAQPGINLSHDRTPPPPLLRPGPAIFRESWQRLLDPRRLRWPFRS